MASLFSSDDKSFIESQMGFIHDSFMRQFIIYRKNNEITIYDNPKHDFIYSQAPINTITSSTPVSGIFNARILYGQKQPLDFFESFRSRQGQDQLSMRKDDGTVRLKLDPTGAAFIEGAERVLLDGTIFTIDAGKRPHGVFSPQYYTFTLKKQI